MSGPRPPRKGLAPCIAVLGTGSDVGKSFLSSGLLRLLRRKGLKVAPFKAQNMSNNSFVTQEGLEMGRAQAVQAMAAGIEPRVAMNPVLLKPSADNKSQLVLKGIAQESYRAQEYFTRHEELFALCLAELNQLRQEYDLIVIEGAGSAVELNLLERDLSNLKLARAVQAEILLVGDIGRGGIFAQLIGSLELMPTEARRLVKGMIVNRFRGDQSLFSEGRKILEERTGVPLLGVLEELQNLGFESEDAYGLQGGPGIPVNIARAVGKRAKVAVLLLPRISNSTDLLPLERDGNFILEWIQGPQSLEDYPLILIPGSKAVAEDLDWLKETGLAEELSKAAHRGAVIFGICGGYQLLGREILDPHGIESDRARVEGLGLLDQSTRFQAEKCLKQVKGRLVLPGEEKISLSGYEIHQGASFNETGLIEISEENARATVRLEGSQKGRVMGSYLHGILDEPGFRHWLLKLALPDYDPALDGFGRLKEERERSFEAMADHLQENLDLTPLHLPQPNLPTTPRTP